MLLKYKTCFILIDVSLYLFSQIYLFSIFQ